MAELLTMLRQVQAGIANPSREEIARAGQDLLLKQIRQSWETRSSENQVPWPATVYPSFAGVLNRHHPSGKGYFNLLYHKENSHLKGYLQVHYVPGKGQKYLDWSSGKLEEQGSHTPTDSFIAQKAMKLVRQAAVTSKGFETEPLPKYGMWQTAGTTKTGWGGPIPARSFWAFGDDLLDLLAALLADKAAKAATRAA